MFRSEPGRRFYAMPAATPIRLPLALALDEGLAVLFRKLQAEPAPLFLLDLVDRLEAARPAVCIAEERRSIA